MTTPVSVLQERVRAFYNSDMYEKHRHTRQNFDEWDGYFRHAATLLTPDAIPLIEAVITTMESTTEFQHPDIRSDTNVHLNELLAVTLVDIGEINKPLMCVGGDIQLDNVLSALHFGYLYALLVGKKIPPDAAYMIYTLTADWDGYLQSAKHGVSLLRNRDDVLRNLQRAVVFINALVEVLHVTAPPHQRMVDFLEVK
jgi:hypothetical protein